MPGARDCVILGKNIAGPNLVVKYRCQVDRYFRISLAIIKFDLASLKWSVLALFLYSTVSSDAFKYLVNLEILVDGYFVSGSLDLSLIRNCAIL